ncbi:MAG: BREX-1 system adenine-specific DNA-methyltransferase PglX [Candidatus Dormibacteraeota bacterium]|uniref:site-specific DNA-methyltransferase (adenine-specific) n=1 Tax=Candidatus Aeolococcus gillhamiae TaxID=3127015 RepID=A0A934JZ26_9BACT|nr:BREX-1 system adenine-specific DNA-methyltransferase PglX [Candidatus Dormibacteraeota bacterium]
MDTAPLKSFATWARTTLIGEVAARISVVLAPGSPNRVEQPSTIAGLEKAVNAAGGGESGRATVTDKVAYTWFNRIIALRFMDANRYTSIGVVSPARAGAGGQPEVLAEAKRGIIDTAVVTSPSTVESVKSLLDGTRRSADPQGEAYALLLAEYCRHWNRSMPFMFEREGDYTELLIPSNLLADESVLARAVAVLTGDVCQDVEVIGWLYQFYISERKDDVFAGFKKNKKAGAAEIPAATQLFTPHWIVRYLVENSLGRLWLLNRPTSCLADQMEYYIAPVDDETDYLKVANLEELKIIDPACGSGHMLTYAFDLLFAVYEEEGYAPADIPGLILTNNLYGTEIDPRAGALAAFALTMKARARQRTFFSKRTEPNICVLEPISFGPDELDFLITGGGDRHEEVAFWNDFTEADTLGSLIQPDPDLTARLAGHLETLDDGGDLLKADLLDRAGRVVAQAAYLTRGYAVALANPPYMGGKNMGSGLAQFAKAKFANSKADLFAMFIDRCTRLVVPRGLVGMITMQSWMFLSSFAALRGKLLSETTVEVLAHLGSGAFDSIGGDVVSTVAFVVSRNSAAERRGVYLNLTAGRSESAKAQECVRLIRDPSDRFVLRSRRLLEVQGAPIAYWLSEAELRALVEANKVSDVATPRKGLVTLNDARFTRRWYEVAASRTCFPTDYQNLGLSRTWYPLNKGGGYRRWYGLNETLINWKDNGQELKDFIVARYGGGSYTKEIRSEEYYFLESSTWGAVSSGPPSFRYTPPGFIFSSGGSSLFSDDALLSVLGSLNSSPVSRLLQTLTPTMNFVPGDVARMPVSRSPRLDELVLAAIELTKADWNDRETSWDFTANQLVAAAAGERLCDALDEVRRGDDGVTERLGELQAEIDLIVSRGLGLVSFDDEALPPVDPRSLTINANAQYEFPDQSATARVVLKSHRLVVDIVSYAVGCMLGRYSLDAPGLILANQGDTLQDYLAKVPNPTFMPDEDNVIPIVDGDWFEDDIVARFRQFLRVAFGEHNFEANLRFVTESLGVEEPRDYFVKSLYKDHVQRYKKRPIYWLFSSPQGSFNALIYMHRYTPSTISTVLNEYLREFKAKLEASRQHNERLAVGAETPRQQAAAQKETDRLRKALLELDEYERDVLYPLATQQVHIDLDDGVKVNYPKFGAALKKIPGLEAADE